MASGSSTSLMSNGPSARSTGAARAAARSSPASTSSGPVGSVSSGITVSCARHLGVGRLVPLTLEDHPCRPSLAPVPVDPNPPAPRSLPGSCSHLMQPHRGHLLHDHLRDPVAAAERHRLPRVEVDHAHADLAAVAGVDRCRARSPGSRRAWPPDRCAARPRPCSPAAARWRYRSAAAPAPRARSPRLGSSPGPGRRRRGGRGPAAEPRGRAVG